MFLEAMLSHTEPPARDKGNPVDLAVSPSPLFFMKDGNDGTVIGSAAPYCQENEVTVPPF
jgi:hypothetical protein